MPLVTTTVPNLIGGVSQQAEDLRFPSQCAELLNAACSPITGLSKRPSSVWVSGLSGLSSAFRFYPVVRSATEKFFLAVGNRSIRAFTLEGGELPVRNASGDALSGADLDYLDSPDPDQIKTTTVADFTFLVNSAKVVRQLSTLSPSRPHEGIVVIKQLRRGATYTVRVATGVQTFSFSVEHIETNIDSTTSTDPKMADQNAVAAALFNQMSSNPAFDGLFTAFHSDGILGIRAHEDNTADFQLTAECSLSEGIVALKDKVQAFEMLPSKAWHGCTICVAGDPDSSGDDYWVEYVASSAVDYVGDIVPGYWRECAKRGIANQFDPATLPHVLVNYGSYFVFKPAVWTPRASGDTVTNPPPSFIDSTIENVFFHKNRLGFLTGESIVLSENAEFWNFWRTTVTQLLDSDPIDVASTRRSVTPLKHTVATSEKFLVFSGDAQLVLGPDDTLTPKSVSLKTASESENSLTVGPQALGESIVYPFQRGPYAGFAELYVVPTTGQFVSADLTEHVPAYIEGTVTAFTASDKGRVIVASTNASARALYVYQFYKKDDKRLQSAWMKWTFDGDVCGFFECEQHLYIVINRIGGTFLERIDLGFSKGETEPSLDCRCVLQVSSSAYDVNSGLTTFSLPYVVGSRGSAPAVTAVNANGVVLNVVSNGGTLVRVQGDQTGKPIYFGTPFTLKADLTRPALRETRNDGSVVIKSGRFQVTYGLVSYSASASFRVEVRLACRPQFVYAMSAPELGTYTATMGSRPLKDGSFRFPVFSRSDQINVSLINDTPQPCALLSLEWEALYTTRASRA